MEKDEGYPVRMRGLPYSISEKDIYDFFHSCGYVRDSVKFGAYKGEASILFDTEAAQKNALYKHGEYIGHRWIELFIMNMTEYDTFDNEGKVGVLRLSDHITAGNEQRAVKLRGLSYQATKGEVVTFFSKYGISEEDVLIEVTNFGKKTGYAMVFMKNREDAIAAQEELNKGYIGPRYVDIFLVKPVPE